MAMLSGSGLTWAQQAEPYSGPLHAQYKEGIRLLEDGHRAWKASDRRAKRFRRIATLLSVLTVVFAAAAGITGLPSGIGRAVSIVVAFCAAVLAGLNGFFNPEREAGAARTKLVQCVDLRDDVRHYLDRINSTDAPSKAELAQELRRLQARRDSISPDDP